MMANVPKETLDNLPAAVLGRAIQRAVDGDYKPDGIDAITSFKTTIGSNQAWVRLFNDDGQEVIQDLEHVIYSHDFAKVLWGGKEVHHYDLVDLDNGGTSTTVNKPIWQYHLQQMVIADNPIDYLMENMPK